MSDLSRRQRFVLVVVLFALCAGAAALVTRRLAGGDVVVIPGAVPEAHEVGSVEAAERDDATGDCSQERGVTVHVCGGVMKPGVYTLPAGSRVADAVQAAGGLAPDACAELVNMAMVLSDSSQVYVPTESREQLRARTGSSEGSAQPHTEPSSVPGGNHARVNINTAGLAELDSLPGIGPVLARKIVDHRNTLGRFERPEQLLDVPGIGAKKYEALKDFVTVY